MILLFSLEWQHRVRYCFSWMLIKNVWSFFFLEYEFKGWLSLSKHEATLLSSYCFPLLMITVYPCSIVASELVSDITVRIGTTKFYLHKVNDMLFLNKTGQGLFLVFWHFLPKWSLLSMLRILVDPCFTYFCPISFD